MAVSSINIRDYITDGSPILYECSFRDGDLAVTENVVFCARRDTVDYTRVLSIDTARCFYYNAWKVSLYVGTKEAMYQFDNEEGARAFFRAVLSAANGGCAELKTLA